MLGIQLLILGVLVILSGVFSGTETALMSLSNIKVNSLLKQKKRGSECLHRIKTNPDKLIITILIGNNLVNIGSATFAGLVFTQIFGSSGVGIATGVMTLMILVFGEIIPKSLASQNAEKISLFVAKPIELLSFLFTPVIVLLEKFTKFVSRLFGSKEGGSLSQEELRTMLSMGKTEGILSVEAARMMDNVLEFEGTKVTDIMTPKINVEVIEADKKLKDVLDYVVKTPYSKYPVISKDDNSILGILDVDDVLRYVKNKKVLVKVKTIVQEPLIIPESKEIDELLTDFEDSKIQIAVIVNEYGDMSGIVTMEDVLEEIVGDIFDKSKQNSVYIKKINKNVIDVDANISLEEINKMLHLGLEDSKFNTLAGFVEDKLHKIPKKGEEIKLKKTKIVVDKVNRQRIKSVKILKE